MKDCAQNIVEGFVLTAESITRAGKTQIALYCASDNGPIRIVSDFCPYFFTQIAAQEHGQPAGQYQTLTGLFAEKRFFPTGFDAEHYRNSKRAEGQQTFESDVRARDRFLMDLRIKGGISVDGPHSLLENTLCFENPTLAPSQYQPNFRICSLDIETSISSHSLLSIGVHVSGRGDEIRRVFMRGTPQESSIDTVFIADEKALLSQFVEWITQVDPDILIGWNVIGFDLAFLLERANVLGVPLKIGRDRRQISINSRSGRFSRANVPGRIVLDGPQLLRSSFHSFESYSLEFVSQRVLGEGKLLASNDDKAWEIERLFRDDKAKLAAYNLKDCVLVTEIFRRLELLELTIRRTQLSGMLLDQVGMSIASLDFALLPAMHDLKIVAPDVEDIEAETTSSGGYVMSPRAGIYDNVLGLDFQSLYPTIIRTFSIDPISRLRKEKNPVRTPSGHTFSRNDAVLPEFIGFLMSQRKLAKDSDNKPLAQAIKILMNSFYGVMGTPGSRMYHPDLPDAITGTGQWLLIESRKVLEDAGHEVIYGDTDSLFVKPKDKTSLDEARELARWMTEYWRERLKKEFDVFSYLQLDFKTYYKKFLVPAARDGSGGAKKRYAGLVDNGEKEELEFVGLEVVRSDWTRLAQDFQRELYSRVFHGEELHGFLRQFVNSLRNGEFDDKLVYRKRLHKPVSEYGKSPPPYVRAAQQLKKPGKIVRYVVTRAGPVPVEKNPQNPDYSHYIQKQLEPVADAALELLGTSFDELVRARQLKLF